jgi:hypothetical protein
MKGRIIVDTLESVWYRQEFELDEEMTTEEFLKAVEDGEICSDEGEYLYETGEPITVKDNDGQATLEIYKEYVEPKNLIYSNATNK